MHRVLSNEPQLHLSLDQQVTSDGVRRELKLKADGESDAIRILYEIFDTGIGDLPVLDGMVHGILLHCMKRGLPVRIHGNLSSSGLYNLHEFQRVWTLWKPQVYRHVDLLPDNVVADRRQAGKVIQAFSGGVDANFTLISNQRLHQPQGGYKIDAALLVHGFDVAYDNSAAFEGLLARVRKTLDSFGVLLKVVRTNSRLLNIQSWMNSNSAQLAACLHQFSNHYGTALIGSGEPYDALALPTGSNPFTDPLLSGNFMTIVHDGASFSRTEKVEALSIYPHVVKQLKVCWEGAAQDENCGRCEKCLRTRLNFAAAGVRKPGCFSDPFDASMLRKLRAKSRLQVIELETILTYMQRRHLWYPWINALRRRILWSRLVLRLDQVFGWQRTTASLRRMFRPLRGEAPAAKSATPFTSTADTHS